MPAFFRNHFGASVVRLLLSAYDSERNTRLSGHNAIVAGGAEKKTTIRTGTTLYASILFNVNRSARAAFQILCCGSFVNRYFQISGASGDDEKISCRHLAVGRCEPYYNSVPDINFELSTKLLQKQIAAEIRNKVPETVRMKHDTFPGAFSFFDRFRDRKQHRIHNGRPELGNFGSQRQMRSHRAENIPPMKRSADRLTEEPVFSDLVRRERA